MTTARYGEEAKGASLGSARGAWGEDVAARYLRRCGFHIVERNVCPVESDRRLEIDIVAWDPKTDAMVFVEVKQHAARSPYARRLARVDRRKRANLRRACNAWRRANKWSGGFRFDVVEVYGAPGMGRPVVDHIERVDLFARPGRFVSWAPGED